MSDSSYHYSSGVEGLGLSVRIVFLFAVKYSFDTGRGTTGGRVLRMPYAKRRSSKELNQAYAFFRVSSWTEAVSKIKDDLFGMGFDDKEVNFALGNQQKLLDEKFTVKITTSEPPQIDSLNMILQNQIFVEKVDDGYSVTLENISNDDLKELTDN